MFVTFNSFDERSACRLKWLLKRLFAKTFWQDWFQPIAKKKYWTLFWIRKINPLISSPRLDQHKFHHICPVHHPSSLPLPPAGMHTSILSWPAALHYYLGSTVVLKASIQPAPPSTSHDSPFVLAHGLTWKWCWKPASRLAWRLYDVEGPLCSPAEPMITGSSPVPSTATRPSAILSIYPNPCYLSHPIPFNQSNPFDTFFFSLEKTLSYIPYKGMPL